MAKRKQRKGFIGLTLDEGLLAWLRERATQKGTTVAQLSREALIEYRKRLDNTDASLD